MRVLVLGGYGLIGLSIVKRLLDEGFAVTSLVRGEKLGFQREPRCNWLRQDIAQLQSPASWRRFLHGVDVVINAAGALQTGLRDNLVDLQQIAISALVDACEQNEVSIVQISAPGATADATTEFMWTKAAADDRLRMSKASWVILKPGLVLAPAAYGGSALLRMLAAFPMILPIVHSEARLATVSIDDVVEAVMMAVEGKVPARTELDVAGSVAPRLDDIVLAFRKWMGFPSPLRIVPLPRWLVAVIGSGADALGWLGWRSPLRTTALTVLKDGIVTDANDYIQLRGCPALTLEETLSRMPSTVQERWFAQMYLAMPILIAILSAFWVTSGIVVLVSLDAAAGHLVNAGYSQKLANLAVVGASIVNIVLGVAVLWQHWAKAACLGMIVVTGLYLVGGSLISQGLWGDPFGALLKAIPSAALAWVASRLVTTR